MGRRILCSSTVNCLNVFQGRVRTLSLRNPQKNMIHGEIIIQLCPGKSRPGKAPSVQLCSSSDTDPDTGKGKLSKQAVLKRGKMEKAMHKESGAKNLKYGVEFNVEPDFGNPGAILIKNVNKHKFFIRSASLHVYGNRILHFECNSWIYPFHLTKQERIFFTNTCYLPNRTPDGLMELRKEELMRLKGDGTGERKEWDRAYDYDCYNDLGDPDKGLDYARPVLGGSETHPYPRRLRTGRPSSNSDIRTESRPSGSWLKLSAYVPPDEQFSQKKMSEFTSNVIRAAMHFVIPEARSILNEESCHFKSFDEIHRLFMSNRGQLIDEWLVKLLKQVLPDDLFKKVKEVMKDNTLKFPLPQIAAENKFAWMDDDEFGRQMLAGTNPTVISLLWSFPPENRYRVQSSIKESDIEHNLDGLTIQEALDQRRIFQLDHHNYLMRFLRRINTKGICAYASRTLLFLKDDLTLKPLVIELSLPGSSSRVEINRVFRPARKGTEAALWQLAKAHVAAVDSSYHHLVNHWLKTHAVVEPFIIATRRNLSALHPIHRLLNRHFKDTIQANALARSMVLNAGGVVENMLFTGSISMELSSFLYKSWRFDQQGLPGDLIKRGMALPNPDRPEKVDLIFEDYPYGVDGLDIWMAIKRWVTKYCSHFYEDDASLRSDVEIQQWWSEIQHVGHGDKCNETWWYEMTTLSDLIETLTTLIWTVSAFHAAISLEQYDYAGYPPNRPVACRKPIPNEGTMEFAEFLRNADRYFLSMLPQRFEMTLGIAFVEVLSRRMSDEVCLGEQQPDTKWIEEERVKQMFKEFRDELREVKERIHERNQDSKLKNRRGRVDIPYEVLRPDTSSGGLLKRGIPNNISI